MAFSNNKDMDMGGYGNKIYIYLLCIWILLPQTTKNKIKATKQVHNRNTSYNFGWTCVGHSPIQVGHVFKRILFF